MKIDELPELVRFMKMDEKLFKTLLLNHDEQALAFAWIKSYLDQLNEEVDKGYSAVELHELISTALDTVPTEDNPKPWPNHILRGPSFEGTSLDPLFYEKLRIVANLKDPINGSPDIFTCSC